MVRGNIDGETCMRRWTAAFSLAGALALSACSTTDRVVGGTLDSLASLGGALGAPWGGSSPASPNDGTTVQRVRAGGGSGGAELLLPEDGNVWPAAEGPRATLANPDEALRGIPSYRPSADASPAAPAEPRTRRQARGSGAAFEPPPGWAPPSPTATAPALGAPRPALPGSVITTPSGSTRTITGTSGNTGTTIGPSGQSGVLLRDGNVQILQEPGRPAQQILTPR